MFMRIRVAIQQGECLISPSTTSPPAVLTYVPIVKSVIVLREISFSPEETTKVAVSERHLILRYTSDRKAEEYAKLKRLIAS